MVRLVAGRLRAVLLALELVEALLDGRDPLLERAEAAELLLDVVQAPDELRRPVEQVLCAGKIGDAADDLLPAIREPTERVLVFLLRHLQCLSSLVLHGHLTAEAPALILRH